MTEEYIIERHKCKCGGIIILEKLDENGFRSHETRSGYAIIKPCPKCNGTTDINGKDLMELFKEKQVII